MPRPLAELLQADEPAWPMVQEWIAQARNPVEVLPAPANAGKELHAVQVTVRSPMGAIVYHTGGVLIDRGWVRILGGGGHPRMRRSLAEWNRGRTIDEGGNSRGLLLVGDDVLGGFFAINGGALGQDLKNVYYFAPDSLRWEPLERGYSDFLLFAFQGDLNQFYAPFRWPGWEQEIAPLTGDQTMDFYPFLFTKEGQDLARAARGERRPIPVAEPYGRKVIDFPRQLGP